MYISSPYVFSIGFAPSSRRCWPVTKGYGHAETEKVLSLMLRESYLANARRWEILLPFIFNSLCNSYFSKVVAATLRAPSICLHLEQNISLHLLHSYMFKAALKELLCPLLGHASNTAIYMHHLVAFHFHNASPHLSHSSIAMLGHGDTTFAWHDISLKFGIKCCLLLGR